MRIFGNKIKLGILSRELTNKLEGSLAQHLFAKKPRSYAGL
jgi:hypothetical protein